MTQQDLQPDEIRAVRMILDKEAIREKIFLYARGVDRKDHDLLDGVYWPEATDDHIAYRGDVAGFKAWLNEFAGEMLTTHFIGNIAIDLLGPTEAFSEAHVIGFHEYPGEDGREDLVVGGRYLDRWEKRNGEWRLVDRIATADFQFKGKSTADWGGIFAGSTARGAAKPDDPLYRVWPAVAKA